MTVSITFEIEDAVAAEGLAALGEVLPGRRGSPSPATVAEFKAWVSLQLRELVLQRRTRALADIDSAFALE